eukprot:6531900-Alexandrium_andersonii.AAC.1
MFAGVPGKSADAGAWMLACSLEHAAAAEHEVSAVACDIWKCFDQVVRELAATSAILSGAPMPVVGA